MSSIYTKHYQDSLDRRIENNDVVRRLLIVDNNLANISQGVNALSTSNATANAISPIYADTQNIRNNQLPNLGSSIAAVNNQVAMVIGGQANQATFNQVNAIVQQIPTLATGNQVNQQAIIIGGVRTDVANLQSSVDAVRAESANIPRNIYNAQLTALQSSVNNIPTYNGSNAIANVQSSLSSQAILIGGIPTNTYNASISNVQTQSDNIASQVGQIPRLIYSSNFSAVGNQLSAIQTTDNSIQNRVNSIPNGTYNAQLDAIQATENAIRTESQNIPRVIYNTQLANIQAGVNNIPVQTYNVALGNIQTTTNTVLTNTNNIPRANHSNQLTAIQNSVNAIPANVYTSNFATVNTKLDNLSTQISGISSGGANGTSGTIALNLTSLTVPYNVNNAGLDLLWCLGMGDAGYITPTTTKIILLASSVGIGDAAMLVDRSDNDFYTDNVTNSWVRIDIANGNTTRRITLTGLGYRSRANASVSLPITLIIEGSNDGTTFNNIFNWNNIGFTSGYQWKYTPSLSNNISYRYLRIRQPGVDSSGSNFLTGNEIRLYGTIDNP